MYDTNFNHIHKFPYIVDNMGIVNDVEFFMTYHYAFWGNAFKKEDMLKLYQMYRKFDFDNAYTEIFDDNYVHFTQIYNIKKSRRRGIFYEFYPSREV